MIAAFSGPQVLVRIRVADSVSDRALPDVSIATFVQTIDTPYRPSPFDLRNMRDGWFVLGASHRALTAKLRIGVTTRVRFDVTLPGYEPIETVLLISEDDCQPINEDIDAGGVVLNRTRLAGAPFEVHIAMNPLPVRLAGQLLQDFDLSNGVEGATITVDGDDGGAVSTDTDGRFLVPVLPLEQTVEIAAVKGDSHAVATHIIDFKQPTNQMTLSFKTEPNT